MAVGFLSIGALILFTWLLGMAMSRWPSQSLLWFILVVVVLVRSMTVFFIPDYSRCVGVDIEKACFIRGLLQVCGFDRSPTP
jgi:hypothetical protein